MPPIPVPIITPHLFCVQFIDDKLRVGAPASLLKLQTEQSIHALGILASM